MTDLTPAALDDLLERLLNISTSRTWDSVGRPYDYPAHLPKEAYDAITSLRAQVETLTAERDEAREAHMKVCEALGQAGALAHLDAASIKARALAADTARASAEAALRTVVDGWDALPGDRHYSPKVMQSWLITHMAPSIETARAALERYEKVR